MNSIKKVYSLLGITHLDGVTVNIEEIGPRETGAMHCQHKQNLEVMLPLCTAENINAS